jgi:hypothetical protein
LLGNLWRKLFNSQVSGILAKLNDPKSLANLAHIDASRALCFTGKACRAQPVRVGVEDFLKAELKVAHDLVR